MPPPQVTFVLPVYNAEKYLRFCLDSIINQSIPEIEVICINDCSTDTSSAILSEYAQRDSRITVINFDKNKGPGAARNAGLGAASGDFIRMVDPDDFIPLESTDYLLKAAKQNNSDFVRGAVWHCDDAGKKVNKNILSPKQGVGRAKMDYRMINYIGQHWTFLLRTEVVLGSGVRYDENMRNGQDAAFMIDLLPYLKKVSLIPESVYNYRVNSESTMHKKRDRQFYHNVFSLYRRAYHVFAGSDLEELADTYLYSHCCGYFPQNILVSIPENLSIDQGIIVLKDLRALFSEFKAKQLCFFRKQNWQSKREVPKDMKYLLLLLENDMFFEGYALLKDLQIRKKKQRTLKKQLNVYQKNIDTIYASTFWRITAPLRWVRNVIK